VEQNKKQELDLRTSNPDSATFSNRCRCYSLRTWPLRARQPFAAAFNVITKEPVFSSPIINPGEKKKVIWHFEAISPL
jgi:hypothetical protein